MSALQSKFTEKDNITAQHLGQKGLGINRKGKGGLALSSPKNTYDNHELKHLRNENSYRAIMVQLI